MITVAFDPLIWGQRVEHLKWENERCIEIPLAGSLAKFGHPGRILDAGCALNVILSNEPVAEITHLTNTLAYEIQRAHPNRRYVEADLRDLSRWPDQYFDRVVCVSTLEHVGMNNGGYGGPSEDNPESAAQAALELWRVTKDRLFITVPFALRDERTAMRKWRPFTPQTLPTIVPHASSHIGYYARRLDGWWGPFQRPQTELAEGKVTQIAAVLACRS